jgi:hypothetical protein
MRPAKSSGGFFKNFIPEYKQFAQKTVEIFPIYAILFPEYVIDTKGVSYQ